MTLTEDVALWSVLRACGAARKRAGSVHGGHDLNTNGDDKKEHLGAAERLAHRDARRSPGHTAVTRTTYTYLAKPGEVKKPGAAAIDARADGGRQRWASVRGR